MSGESGDTRWPTWLPCCSSRLLWWDHPGYVDNFVYRLGDYGSAAWTTILSRVKDVEALCSARMRNWIKENHIERINFRDALYGTNECQNHLKLIGSDLAIQNEAADLHHFLMCSLKNLNTSGMAPPMIPP